jgi:hypothetical protein
MGLKKACNVSHYVVCEGVDGENEIADVEVKSFVSEHYFLSFKGTLFRVLLPV